MVLTPGRSLSLLGIVLLGACSSGSPPSPEGSAISVREQALSSQTISASLSLPSGLTSAGLLIGQSNIQLDSNIVVPGPVWSGGSLYFQLE
jgi:hypothetical protein